MSVTLLWILAITFLNGLVAFVGAFSLLVRRKSLDKILLLLVAFSAGTLLAGALLHLLPHALESLTAYVTLIITLMGFTLFFIIEKFIHWHHCKGADLCELQKPKKALGQMVLFADGIHNFIDGLIIAASFLVTPEFGIITSFLIITHEVPQELGNFGVLVYSGFSRVKALIYNFVVQLTCVVGGIVGYFISASSFSKYLLPFAAGGFIYIAASDLIPELHKEVKLRESALHIAFFLMGVFIIGYITFGV